MPHDNHPSAQSAHWAPENPRYRTPRLASVAPSTMHCQAIPDRQWLVHGWIPAGAATILGGDGGQGKTLLAQQLLTACGTGGKWLGLDVMACKALGIFCEDDRDELHRRQAAINAMLEIEFADLDDVTWVPRVGDDNAIMAYERSEMPGRPTEFFQQVHNLAMDAGAQLIVLDSLHDLFPGNENSRVHARQFISLLTGLARDIGGAVILCAHPSVTGLNTGSGMSGSTAWNNAVRSRLYLDRPKDRDNDADAKDLRELHRRKSNYARSGDKLLLRWRDGAFVREDAPTGAVKAIEDGRADRLFLACLDTLTAQRRAVSYAKNAQGYAPKVMASLPQAEGLRPHDFAAAMERLFASGEIVNGSPFLKANRHPAVGIVRASS